MGLTLSTGAARSIEAVETIESKMATDLSCILRKLKFWRMREFLFLTVESKEAPGYRRERKKKKERKVDEKRRRKFQQMVSYIVI